MITYIWGINEPGLNSRLGFLKYINNSFATRTTYAINIQQATERLK